MDSKRFLDLYAAEAQEHVDLLHRSLIALESASAGGSLDEAFRAAHTLKGLSAAMGYSAVARIAHGLEDRLHEIRAGRLVVSPTLVDELLEAADRLESAVAISLEGGAAAAGPEHDDATPDAAHASAGSSPGAANAMGDAAAAVVADDAGHDAPPGTVLVARIRLKPDAPIKSARATLVLRALAESCPVLGSAPPSFDDEFDGRFVVFFGPGLDTRAAESAIVAAGEVDSFEFASPREPAGGRPGGASAAGAAAAAFAAAPEASPATPKVRVDARRLDKVADDIAELTVLYGRVDAQRGLPAQLTDMIARMGTVLTSLQHDVLALRMVPVRQAFERLPRVVRDASRSVGKEVELLITGDEVELDRTILEEIGDPLVHLLRNAVDHGIEGPDQRAAAGKPPRGRIRVSAERERTSVRITVEDDGGGVQADKVLDRARAAGLVTGDASAGLTDEELFRLLSHAGFSTAEQVTAVSGRGVGMDVVVSRIRALGGAIEMQSRAGAGTVFSIRLPITLALALALRVRVGGEDYAIPLTHVSEAVDLDLEPQRGSAREKLQLRDEQLPLVRMRRMLQIQDPGEERAAVIAEMGGRRAALAVDELVGREQILVRSFDPVVGTLPFFSGATLLADGRPALVLDPLSVV